MTSTENYFEDLINGGAYPSKEIIKYFSKRTESLFDAVYEVERRDKRRDLEFISGAFFKCFEKTEMYKFLHEKIVYFLDSFDLSRYTVLCIRSPQYSKISWINISKKVGLSQILIFIKGK